MNEPEFALLRQEMITEIRMHTAIVSEEIGKADLDEAVLTAIGKVPRHEFVPVELQSLAYADSPLPIGHGKTISQPFIVALMTDLLQLDPADKVLEVGTGLGYQAAILAELAGQVYTVEIFEELASQAVERLRRRGCDNVETRVGDGGQGWPAHAPFDKIIVTAAPELIPPPLLEQLDSGGRMVIPAGIEDAQQLMLVEKNASGHSRASEILAVRFSPLVVAH